MLLRQCVQRAPLITQHSAFPSLPLGGLVLTFSRILMVFRFTYKSPHVSVYSVSPSLASFTRCSTNVISFNSPGKLFGAPRCPFFVFIVTCVQLRSATGCQSPSFLFAKFPVRIAFPASLPLVYVPVILGSVSFLLLSYCVFSQLYLSSSFLCFSNSCRMVALNLLQ